MVAREPEWPVEASRQCLLWVQKATSATIGLGLVCPQGTDVGASVVHPALLDNSINCQQQADVCTGKDAVIQRYDGQINDVQ